MEVCRVVIGQSNVNVNVRDWNKSMVGANIKKESDWRMDSMNMVYNIKFNYPFLNFSLGTPMFPFLFSYIYIYSKKRLWWRRRKYIYIEEDLCILLKDIEDWDQNQFLIWKLRALNQIKSTRYWWWWKL